MKRKVDIKPELTNEIRSTEETVVSAEAAKANKPLKVLSEFELLSVNAGHWADWSKWQ